jgi:hypothetical protein
MILKDEIQITKRVVLYRRKNDVSLKREDVVVSDWLVSWVNAFRLMDIDHFLLTRGLF